MSGTSSKTRLVTLRLSNYCCDEFDRLTRESPSNPHKSGRTYMQWVLETFIRRHDKTKYHHKIN